MTAIDTVPTALEALGDFSQAGVRIFNPATSRANPNFDPSKPVSAKNPQILRDPCARLSVADVRSGHAAEQQ
jgi:hypothetical protein